MVGVIAIIEGISGAVKIGQALIQAGKDAQPAVAAIRKLLAKEEITQDDLDELEKTNEQLSAELDAPIQDSERQKD